MSTSVLHACSVYDPLVSHCCVLWWCGHGLPTAGGKHAASKKVQQAHKARSHANAMQSKAEEASKKATSLEQKAGIKSKEAQKAKAAKHDAKANKLAKKAQEARNKANALVRPEHAYLRSPIMAACSTQFMWLTFAMSCYRTTRHTRSRSAAPRDLPREPRRSRMPRTPPPSSPRRLPSPLCAQPRNRSA